MTQRFFLNAHTIEDKIVLDCIGAVNSIPEKKFVTGGMAVQIYVPQDLWRHTTDLDITTSWHGKAITAFRSFLEPFVKRVTADSYAVEEIQKKDHTFDVKVSSSRKKEKLLIQFPRRSPSNYEKMRHKFDRESSHARVKSINGLEFSVLSPEDIILRKAYRIMKYKEHGIQIDKKAYEGDLLAFAEYITKYREELFSRFDNVLPSELTNLRAHSDILDVLAIKNNVALDNAYFREASKDYQRLNNCDEIAKATFTELEIGL